MKNYTTPRTMSDAQFHVGYECVHMKQRGFWYGLYLTVCGVATLALVVIAANGG